MGPYVAALEKEIAAAPALRARSIYVGGGTPSHLPLPLMERIFAALKRKFPFDPNAEITMEVNPVSASRGIFDAWRRFGVNRLSIGVQTFDDRLLKGIGRAHDGATARETFYAAREAGFGNISLDLIYGLPGQSLKDCAADVEAALALRPDHLSAYQLIVEEGTPLIEMAEQHKVEMPEEDLTVRMGELVTETLGDAGYAHYEISNYALPEKECRHNLAYWLGKPFLGLGSGAHSFLAGARFANPDHVEEYIGRIEDKGNAATPIETDGKARITDYMLMRTRLINKEIEYEEISNALSINSGEYFKPALEKLAAEGYVTLTAKGFTLTKKGIQYQNHLLLELTRV